MKRKFKEWWSTILPIIKQNEQLSLSPQTVEHKKDFFKKCKPKLIYLVKKKLRLIIAWISIHLEKNLHSVIENKILIILQKKKKSPYFLLLNISEIL
jgi:hypothetical protein